MEDTYLSVGARARTEIKVKGSRFIAEAVPVQTVDEAEAEIAAIRKREHSATHHCTAYRLGPDGELARYNDDGEPSGTAGAPILRQIEGKNLTNTLVVVTRYFGGTKLGTGGLARAYGEAAEQVLDATNFVRHVISRRVNVSFDYDDTSPAMRTIEQTGAEIVGTNYSDRTHLTLAVRRSRVQNFVRAFTDALGGRGSVVVEDGEDAAGH